MTGTDPAIDRAWHRGTDGVSYPPEPWYLGGDLLASVFAVPRRELPAHARDVIPRGGRPVVVGGRVLVTAAFIRYTEGGVLPYDELLTAFPVISRGLRVSIPDIWVTSPNSRTGGRELWGIPKFLGDFTRERSESSIRTSMQLDGDRVAALDASLGRRIVPGSRQLPLPTAQLLDGRASWSTNRIIGSLRTLRADWWFDPRGPLGYLAGRSPILSVAATDAAVLFGTKVIRA